MSARTVSRRAFVKAGGVLAATVVAGGALAGCAGWTPRSQTAEQGGSFSEQSETEEVMTVEDGMVFVAGGTFLMGSPESEPWRGADEMQHAVALRDFRLASREVTQREYEEAMGANPSATQGADLPVESVTWLDAVTYCNALSARDGLAPAYAIEGTSVTWDRSADGYRLPTEAEWEYACRAGTDTPFNTQASIDASTQANYYGTYPYEIESHYFAQDELETSPGVYRQAPVPPGSFPANAWGFFDMHGNVAEWVWDVCAPYELAEGGAEAPVDNPAGAVEGAPRVNRGGGWNDFGKNLRSAYRAALPADASSVSVGFRVARNAVAGEGVVGAGAASAAGAAAGGDALIVFYSWSGNTRGIAQEIARQTGYSVVELELETPYSSNYSTVLDQSQRDQNVQARPALKTRIDDMERYGTVFVGYPNWWASIPMPIATFLESYDFSGKTILPFSSNGGGGLGQSVSAISKLAPRATVKDGLSIYYSGGASLADDVSAWLDACGVVR